MVNKMKPLKSILSNPNQKPLLTLDQLMQKRKDGTRQFNQEIISTRKEAQQAKALKSIGRTGVMPLHLNCSVNNFTATTQDQKRAKKFTMDYILNFENNKGKGFVFSGLSGTGKNHLSAAICNKLDLDGYKCLSITVNELTIKLRDTYKRDSKVSESDLLDGLIELDFLVLDEVGLQRDNDHEKLLLNHVFDKRVGHLKPTAILTNLEGGELSELLGERIMRRMRENGGCDWVAFNWASHVDGGV